MRSILAVGDLILPYTVCTALHTQCFLSVCKKNSQATWARFEHTTSRLRVQTSQPLDVLTSLPDDDWPARIP